MINEIFKILQGEGKTIGQERLLIRFNGCNLSCNFCDTKYTWGKGDTKINLNKYNKLLKSNKKWMITGGEPMLYQNQIVEMINKYKPNWVEIETNGTIQASNIFLKKIDLFNISPKEKTHQLNKMRNVEPILLLQKNKMNDYILKFVISNNKLKFVKNIEEKYKIDKNRIFLMPLSTFNIKNDDALRKSIYDLALKKGYNFCPRLHVMIFNEERKK